jgi:hypothetical protein
MRDFFNDRLCVHDIGQARQSCFQVRPRAAQADAQQGDGEFYVASCRTTTRGRDNLRMLQSERTQTYDLQRNVRGGTEGELYRRLPSCVFRLAGLRHVARGEELHQALRLDGLDQLLLHVAERRASAQERRPLIGGL